MISIQQVKHTNSPWEDEKYPASKHKWPMYRWPIFNQLNTQFVYVQLTNIQSSKHIHFVYGLFRPTDDQYLASQIHKQSVCRWQISSPSITNDPCSDANYLDSQTLKWSMCRWPIFCQPNIQTDHAQITYMYILPSNHYWAMCRWPIFSQSKKQMALVYVLNIQPTRHTNRPCTDDQYSVSQTHKWSMCRRSIFSQFNTDY